MANTAGQTFDDYFRRRMAELVKAPPAGQVERDRERKLYAAMMARTPMPDAADVLRPYLRRPKWMASAACRGKPTAMFFPARGEPAAPAKAICAGCSEKVACLSYAQTGVAEGTPLEGIWGATSAQERRTLRGKAPTRLSA